MANCQRSGNRLAAMRPLLALALLWPLPSVAGFYLGAELAAHSGPALNLRSGRHRVKVAGKHSCRQRQPRDAIPKHTRDWPRIVPAPERVQSPAKPGSEKPRSRFPPPTSDRCPSTIVARFHPHDLRTPTRAGTSDTRPVRSGHLSFKIPFRGEALVRRRFGNRCGAEERRLIRFALADGRCHDVRMKGNTGRGAVVRRGSGPVDRGDVRGLPAR